MTLGQKHDASLGHAAQPLEQQIYHLFCLFCWPIRSELRDFARL